MYLVLEFGRRREELEMRFEVISIYVYMVFICVRRRKVRKYFSSFLYVFRKREENRKSYFLVIEKINDEVKFE